MEDKDFDRDDVDLGHIIKQDKDSEECPHCLCRHRITDEERRQ